MIGNQEMELPCLLAGIVVCSSPFHRLDPHLDSSILCTHEATVLGRLQGAHKIQWQFDKVGVPAQPTGNWR